MQAKAWQKECGKCWLSSRGVTHTTCPSCVGEDALKLSMPNGSSSCRKCKEMHFRQANESKMGIMDVDGQVKHGRQKRAKK